MSAEVITKIFIQGVEDRADIVSFGPASTETKKLIKIESWSSPDDTCSWSVSILGTSEVSYRRNDGMGELWMDGKNIGEFKLKP